MCGTTIGILQHPDIKNGDASASFDVLVIDEASKTTFQEFLVPALYAKRWVIVGDPKQLSPYVDDDAMAINVESCLPSEDVRNACIDVFMAGQNDPHRRRVAAVASESVKVRQAYAAQAAARDVDLADADADYVSSAAIVVGDLESMQRRAHEMPLDVATIRAPDSELKLLRRQADAWLYIEAREREEQPEWASEIAWRLTRLYEQRFAKETIAGIERRGGRSTSARLREQVDELLPAPETGHGTDKVWNEIDRVRRVALPSILESLRHGFERDPERAQRHGPLRWTARQGARRPLPKGRHAPCSIQHSSRSFLGAPTSIDGQRSSMSLMRAPHMYPMRMSNATKT